MAGKKKFGFFTGVFTPSILTILGVIMYMRLGWVVGNAGLVGTIAIIIIAHIIAVTTGLSVSSVATDKKIGAGGIYYVLSRSMGIPIGGSIGIALYIGTAFSIALYLIGFAESFNGYFGLGMTVNDFRITGTIALISITVLALISTSVALKAQFFILAAIIISLISIFFGTSDYTPQVVNMFATEGSVPLEVVFAIFFPAVTGFTAGIAMSGDLKDPKKSIPVGTLLAIGVGLVVYLGLAVFIAYNIDSETLKSDYNILMKIAMFAPAVVAGIWGATLSSALGGILGGPRILQAMSLDKVTPRIFGKGKGKDNEPVNALFLVFIIAEAGILIGELDVIARVVSMFYLAAYGFINISYYLESWANPDFQPSFKIKRSFGLVGAIACFAVMFKLDMLAMFAALALIGGLYFWLQRKQIKLQSNDVWQSVWSNVVNKGLKRLDAKDGENDNWNPNIILFSGESNQRPKLLSFTKILSGRTGIVTDFKLVRNEGDDSMSKNQQSYKDEDLDKLGIYGKRIEVDDIYTGVEHIASTYGFTGVEPNTVMMNWSRTTQSPEKYMRMTQKLIQLDYNLLYLDYDEKTHFGTYQTIDLWWRETDSNNAEMMLNISRYISQSPEWSKAKLRILFVNHNNADNSLIKSKISILLAKLRIDAEIVVINNGVEQKSFYKIIEIQSAKTDLIVLGIPNVKADKQAEFILNTDELFETVGTTLLVKASNNFNVLDLNFEEKESFTSEEVIELKPLAKSKHEEINEAIVDLDNHLFQTAQLLAEPGLQKMSSSYYQLVNEAKKQFEKSMLNLDENHSVIKVAHEIQVFLNYMVSVSDSFKNETLPEVEELFAAGVNSFSQKRKIYLQNAPRKIRYTSDDGKKSKVYWQNILDYYFKSKIIPNTELTLLDLGVHNYVVLNKLADDIKEQTHLFIEKMSVDKSTQKAALSDFTTNIIQTFDDVLHECICLKAHTINSLSATERDVCIELLENVEDPLFYRKVKLKRRKIVEKEINQLDVSISEYPSHWQRNQNLAHNQMQADFILTSAGVSVFMVNETIKSRVYKNTIVPQQKEIELFTEAVNFITENIESGNLKSYSNKTIDKLIEGIPHVDFDELLKNEENRILSFSNKAPEHVFLMDSKSIVNFNECQDDELTEIEVSLANIQNHIIQSSYLAPLQKSLLDLEQVFKENSEELYNQSNLVKHILTEPASDKFDENYKKSILEVQKCTANCLSDLKKIENSFAYNLSIHIHNTLADLNVRTIIESIDSYSKLSSHSVAKSKLQLWYGKQTDIVSKKYNSVYDFVLQRKRDVDSIKFIGKYNKYLSASEQTNDFLNRLDYSSELENDLSFYYKKLFTGSHLASINPIYKGKEIDVIKNTISRIDTGINGAIMVLGESSSGKSYFIESITKLIGDRDKVFIRPPLKQNYDVNDIHSAFQNSFGKSGTAESILGQLDNKTILIIDDIEQWWVKAPQGSAAVNYLSKLIDMYGSQHYFILACNIFSFDIIRKSSVLEKQLLANILVPPMSKAEMKEVLMNRHRTGGAEIWFNNELLRYDSKKVDVLFNDIHQKSNGNIGAALLSWISSIKKDEDGNLMVRKSNRNRFPSIINPQWKALLYLFVIHGSLNEEQISRMFKNTDWVYSTLKEFEKTTLIHKKSSTHYSINNSAKHYIEEWLKDLKILND